ADAGLVLGAMAMAATYDPAELDRLGLLGLKPDREAARRWYERARQLGGADAEQQLQRLGPN
ncbi:MAG TPA: sel1 repeat family protein, partial [Pseudolabrys sp.]|nr:sel1 repeat family protein [Pseudolabrys sp.]